MSEEVEGGTATKTPAPPAIKAGTGEFISTIPLVNAPPDCIAFTCSDHRTRAQNLEFLDHMGFKNPHVIGLPGGVAITVPLFTMAKLIPGEVGSIMEKAIAHYKTQNVVLITHEDCSAYRSERLGIIGTVLGKATGTTMKDFQVRNLKDAGRRLGHTIPRLKIQAFYAEFLEAEGKVKYIPVPLD